VPTDVAVVGFDDIEEGRHTTPDLTTVAVDLGVLADAAVDSLVRRLDDPSTPEGSSIVVPHRLVVRGSTVAPDPPCDIPVR
jgi:DNA-binding LacI/PurR family transcriptional regulator